MNATQDSKISICQVVRTLKKLVLPELMLDWVRPLLIEDEADVLVAWHHDVNARVLVNPVLPSNWDQPRS